MSSEVPRGTAVPIWPLLGVVFEARLLGFVL